MHYLIGLIAAIMALFPASDGGGVSLYQRWMDAYEKYLYQQMAENFEREKRERNADIWQNPAESEVSVEQTASEEETPQICVGSELQEVVETNTEAVPENPVSAGTEADVPVPQADTPDCEPVTPLYQVNGAVLDIGVQEYLYQRLCEAGIGWFYHYAILIAYQESRFDFYAVNQKNHLDMGLFQYRSTYWSYGDIFNPYDQINVFTIQMMQRANVGCSVAEMISRHKTSDWGSYDQEYVNQVMQWESTIVRIR